MDVQRIAAFSQGAIGGNPAGVVLCEALPPAERMLAIAAEVGYSETVFAAPSEDGWRVRYFAPEIEVPFCGHATIALGAALALAHGDGTFTLQLNDSRITVTGWRKNPALMAVLQSPPTRSAQAPRELVEAALDLFSFTSADPGPDQPAKAGRDAL
jgi:PhzF family phenazine biosynthesis protein